MTETLAASHATCGGLTHFETEVVVTSTPAFFNDEDSDPFVDNVIDCDWERSTEGEVRLRVSTELRCACGADLTGKVEVV